MGAAVKCDFRPSNGADVPDAAEIGAVAPDKPIFFQHLFQFRNILGNKICLGRPAAPHISILLP